MLEPFPEKQLAQPRISAFSLRPPLLPCASSSKGKVLVTCYACGLFWVLPYASDLGCEGDLILLHGYFSYSEDLERRQCLGLSPRERHLRRSRGDPFLFASGISSQCLLAAVTKYCGLGRF